jgi:hypothetical protein
VIALGPRPEVDTNLQPPDLPDGVLRGTSRTSPAAAAAELDAYLARSEARFGDLRPGTEKTIVWAKADRTRSNR